MFIYICVSAKSPLQVSSDEVINFRVLEQSTVVGRTRQYKRLSAAVVSAVTLLLIHFAPPALAQSQGN